MEEAMHKRETKKVVGGDREVVEIVEKKMRLKFDDFFWTFCMKTVCFFLYSKTSNLKLQILLGHLQNEEETQAKL